MTDVRAAWYSVRNQVWRMHSSRLHDRLRVGVVSLVVALAVVRLFCATRAELLPEEAYYWTYWKHPALSYYDHPPMVAWVIGAGTTLFGDTEFGVRFGTIVLSLASCGLLFLTGRLWFGRQAALWAALLFTILPIFLGTGSLAFTDGPLVFFWLLTMYAVTKAIHHDSVAPQPLAGGTSSHTTRQMYWLLAGLAFGGALLSKYTAVLLAPSLLLFLLFSRQYRGWLRRPEPWVALALALVVFSPVIIWNAQHDWASFRFQTSRTSQLNPHTAHDVLTFWVMQVGVLTPLLLLLFAAAAVRAIRLGWLQHQDHWNFAAAFFLPLFLVFVRASFKTNVHINWTAPAYLSLSLAAGAILEETLAHGTRWWKTAGLTAVGTGLAVTLVLITNLTWGIPGTYAYPQAGGWRQLNDIVEAAEHKLEAATAQKVFTIGADKYDLAAELGFYTREPGEQVNLYAFGGQGLGYRYWSDLSQFEGHPMITVLNKLNDETLAMVRKGFDHLDEPRRVDVLVGEHRTRTFYVVNCYGFRAPPNDGTGH